ncbi:MAG: hypothetical protein EBV45_12005, partial [Chloroflexi bacterium]|nr:hypothetical protein [Chloroflexota bacterium]
RPIREIGDALGKPDLAGCRPDGPKDAAGVAVCGYMLDTGVAGIVLVADSRNHRIQRLTTEGRFLGALGGPGDGAGEFDAPIGLAVDRSGNVAVADSGNHRVQVFDPDGRHRWTVGGIGSQPGQFRGPEGVLFDGQGRLVVADTSNDRIQIFGLSDRVDPVPEHVIGRRGKGVREFDEPIGLAVNAHGDLLVSEYGNHRIQRVVIP